jgi:hypothetical protein
VFEKALRAGNDAQPRAVLRRLRAEMAAGLARSQAAAARPLSVLGTLAASAPYAWRYRQWWAGAARALLQAFAPARLRARLIRWRSARRAPGI